MLHENKFNILIILIYALVTCCYQNFDSIFIYQLLVSNNFKSVCFIVKNTSLKTPTFLRQNRFNDNGKNTVTKYILFIIEKIVFKIAQSLYLGTKCIQLFE